MTTENHSAVAESEEKAQGLEAVLGEYEGAATRLKYEYEKLERPSSETGRVEHAITLFRKARLCMTGGDERLALHLLGVATGIMLYSMFESEDHKNAVRRYMAVDEQWLDLRVGGLL